MYSLLAASERSYQLPDCVRGRSAMLHLTRRGAGFLVAALASLLPTPSGHAASTDVPAPGQSPKIDAIKERGSLRVAAIGEFPWLPENTTGSGRSSRPGMGSGRGVRQPLGRAARSGAGQPRDQGADPRDRRCRHLDRAARGHTAAPGGGQFRGLFALLAVLLLASNPKLQDAKTVDDLNRDDLTMAYFTGTPPRPGRRRASPRSRSAASPARAPMRRSRR